MRYFFNIWYRFVFWKYFSLLKSILLWIKNSALNNGRLNLSIEHLHQSYLLGRLSLLVTFDIRQWNKWKYSEQGIVYSFDYKTLRKHAFCWLLILRLTMLQVLNKRFRNKVLPKLINLKLLQKNGTNRLIFRIQILNKWTY